MASPGNQHCANCIGTLSFFIGSKHNLMKIGQFRRYARGQTQTDTLIAIILRAKQVFNKQLELETWASTVFNTPESNNVSALNNKQRALGITESTNDREMYSALRCAGSRWPVSLLKQPRKPSLEVAPTTLRNTFLLCRWTLTSELDPDSRKVKQ